MTVLILLAQVGIINSKSYAADEKKSSSDKMDLEQLEKKYWSAKDDDYAVVQNRTFTKEHRFYVGVSGGIPINDPYSTGQVVDLSTGYFFNERWGVEYSRSNYTYRNNDSTDQFINAHQTVPNHNVISGSQSVNLIWVPFYAKMSFLNTKIIYFDMGMSAGIGQTSWESQVASGNKSGTAQSYNIDLHQTFFFSKLMAIKVNYRNIFTNETQYQYGSSSASLGTKSISDTQLLVGLQFWF